MMFYKGVFKKMSEKRFKYKITDGFFDGDALISIKEVVDVLNEQQELIGELQVSDEMGWKRAEHFEKKCPKELHNKKMYIKRLEYKVQKFKEENEQLKHYKLYEDNKRLQTIIADLKEENEQLHQKNTKLISKIDFLERVIDGDV